MNISLIICTKNRCNNLPELFKFLERINTTLAWELVVVDNGSEDGTQEFLKKIQKEIQFSMKIVFEAKPGLGNARNAGVKVAVGEIIAFTDDDCYPDTNLLDSIFECFQHDAIDYLGGRILLFDKTDFPITIQESLDYAYFKPNTFIEPGFIQGANFSFKKELLKKHNFNPLLGAGTPFSSEDVEFIATISFAGYKGAYSPHPLVYHHHRRKKENAIEILRKQYDYGRGAYFASMILTVKNARMAYIKNWYWRIKTQSIIKTCREIIGFLHYSLYEGIEICKSMSLTSRIG